MLVRAKKKVNRGFHARIDVRPVTLCIFSHNRFVSILAIIPAGCVLYNKCSQLSRQQLVPIYVIKQGDPPPKGSSKLHDPPLAQGSKPHDPPLFCSGPPILYFLTSPLWRVLSRRALHIMTNMGRLSAKVVPFLGFQHAKTSVSPRSSPPGTFRQEERLRLGCRNSILMTQTNVYITNPVVMGF